MRQPVVLARSAASLDLLTGGRVELGLGAGAFWDAIEASGGERRTPGQALTALDEAVRIIRAVWDTGQRGGVHVEGEHYRVVGAKRGPAPAHDIGIWIGGYRPRMLSLIGRVADGWLPSLPHLPGGPAELADLNARIDDAAVEAGREPTAVRRLLNITGRFTDIGSGLLTGPVKQWIDELAGLALDHGISGFILASDDPDALDRFAQDVAPAVRELIAEPNSAAAPPAVIAPTPDPGVRLTGHTLWDESTRPQAPPGYEYTPRDHNIGARLVEVHDHLRAELTQVRAIIGQVRRGAATAAHARSVLNEMTMRQNNWSLGAYCESYCSVVTQHHHIEDGSVFPHLRRADRALVPVIDRLQAEHVVIHDVIEGVDRALVDFINGPDDFAKLQYAVDLLTDTLLSHLSYEESTVLEPLARHGFYDGQR